MGIREREEQRKSVVGSLISHPAPKNRKSAEEKEKIQRAYYLAPEIVKGLKIEAAKRGMTASSIVEDALKQYLEV